MQEVEEIEVMLGDEKTTQWIIKDKNGFIIWSTYDKEIAKHKMEILKNNN